MKTHTRSLLVPAVALIALGMTATTRSEIIIGLTGGNGIISFDSASPGTTTPLLPITGLASGVLIVGIDRRPQDGANNGLLYGLGRSGTTGTIYTINTATGAATLVSTLSVPLASANSFGIDFNPTVDRLRIVSDTNQNLRANVDTGATIVDGTLAFAAGDPNAGGFPFVDSIAYTNNFGGATTTTLRGIDVALDRLVIQDPPNAGTLNTSTALGVGNVFPFAGYDISGLTGTAYASLGGGAATTQAIGFYTLSATGATLVGPIGGVAFASIVDIAAPVGTPVTSQVPDGGTGLVGLAALGLVTWVGVRRNRRLASAQ